MKVGGIKLCFAAISAVLLALWVLGCREIEVEDVPRVYSKPNTGDGFEDELFALFHAEMIDASGSRAPVVFDYDRLLVEGVGLRHPIPRLGVFRRKGFQWGAHDGLILRDDGYTNGGGRIVIWWQFGQIQSFLFELSPDEKGDDAGKTFYARRAGKEVMLARNTQPESVVETFGRPFHDGVDRSGGRMVFYEFPGDQEIAFTFGTNESTSVYNDSTGVEWQLRSVEMRAVPILACPEGARYGFTNRWSDVRIKTDVLRLAGRSQGQPLIAPAKAQRKEEVKN